MRADRVIPKVEIRTHEDTKILERDIFVSPESIIILDPELAPLVIYMRYYTNEWMLPTMMKIDIDAIKQELFLNPVDTVFVVKPPM